VASRALAPSSKLAASGWVSEGVLTAGLHRAGEGHVVACDFSAGGLAGPVVLFARLNGQALAAKAAIACRITRAGPETGVPYLPSPGSAPVPGCTCAAACLCTA
jgi:hypothetical protein